MPKLLNSDFTILLFVLLSVNLKNFSVKIINKKNPIKYYVSRIWDVFLPTLYVLTDSNQKWPFSEQTTNTSKIQSRIRSCSAHWDRDGFFQSISCWDNCRNNWGVFLTVATASWDTVMFVILHATLFDIHAPFYWCLTLCNENMEFDPQNKKMTPPPTSKPPSIGAWPLVMKIGNLTPKTKKMTPLAM